MVWGVSGRACSQLQVLVVSSERGPAGSCAGITEVQEKLLVLDCPSLQPDLSETSREGWLSLAALPVQLGPQHWRGCSAPSPSYICCSLLFCLTGEVCAIFFICLYFTICIFNHFSTDRLLWYLLFYKRKISYFSSNQRLLLISPWKVLANCNIKITLLYINKVNNWCNIFILMFPVHITAWPLWIR